jgi:hypothetical protein
VEKGTRKSLRRGSQANVICHSEFAGQITYPVLWMVNRQIRSTLILPIIRAIYWTILVRPSVAEVITELAQGMSLVFTVNKRRQLGKNRALHIECCQCFNLKSLHSNPTPLPVYKHKLGSNDRLMVVWQNIVRTIPTWYIGHTILETVS